MKPYGFKFDNTYQNIDNYITFYPKEYFCPIEHANDIKLTENTYTIHYFAGSWQPWRDKMKKKIIRLLGKNLWKAIRTVYR